MVNHLDYLRELSHLRFCRIRFCLRATRYTVFYGDLSSMIRGSLGWALRDVTCLRECDQSIQKKYKIAKDCGIARCPFRRTFLAKEWPTFQLNVTPKNYRILAPRYDHMHPCHAGEHLFFDLVLFGHGITDAPFWILAVLKAGARGFTKHKVPFRLESATDIFTEEILWTRDKTTPPLMPSISHLYEMLPDVPSHLRSLSLLLRSPVALKQITRDLSLPSLSVFVRAALRRLHALMCRFEYFVEHTISRDEIELFSDAAVSGTLKAWHQDRYSSRLGSKVPLYGVTGELKYELYGYKEWIWFLLHMASIVGVGNYTIMGFGAFDIKFELQDLNFMEELDW